LAGVDFYVKLTMSIVPKNKQAPIYSQLTVSVFASNVAARRYIVAIVSTNPSAHEK